MKFAILGGGGCFALNLARTLIAHGHEAIGCGRSALRGEAFTLGAERTGYRYRQLVVGADNEFIMDWLDAERPHVVVNFAAQGEGAASYKARNWKYFYRTNIVALADLTEMMMERSWLQRFVQVGTSEVYGSVLKPAPEDAAPKPSSVYANSKLAYDLHLQCLTRHWGFPAVIVRPSNCMTPGQQLHRVVPKTFLLALTRRRLELHGGGRARKSYMAADDLSEAILLVAQRGTTGEIYNVGPEVPVSIRRLVELCGESMSRKLEEVATVAPDRAGEDDCYWIDSAKIKALGWIPRVTLEGAIAQVYHWVQCNLDALARLPTEFEMRA